MYYIDKPGKIVPIGDLFLYVGERERVFDSYRESYIGAITGEENGKFCDEFAAEEIIVKGEEEAIGLAKLLRSSLESDIKPGERYRLKRDNRELCAITSRRGGSLVLEYSEYEVNLEDPQNTLAELEKHIEARKSAREKRTEEKTATAGYKITLETPEGAK
jgi:hypothetical protein